MYEEMKAEIWHGRIDDYEEGNALRWHQVVHPLDQVDQPGIALLGVCSDEGVRRNLGRHGARKGPNAIRHALAPMPLHLDAPIYDAGNIHCDLGDLDELSMLQADWVYKLLDQGHFPLLLGGGHEIAYGSFMGLQRFLSTRIDGPVGILNFDSHFDLRQDKHPSSGTPFLQIAHLCQQLNMPFHYAVLGISESANTRALFQRARQLNVSYMLDSQLNGWLIDDAYKMLEQFIAPLGALYLTIDLDVLPASVAPGVSAPAGRGIALEVLEALIEKARQLAGLKLRMADIAEYNPDLDIDRRTARVAARLCHLILREP
ncbi:MAG: formimidoylglutamase [Motiliproteus sp.]